MHSEGSILSGPTEDDGSSDETGETTVFAEDSYLGPNNTEVFEGILSQSIESCSLIDDDTTVANSIRNWPFLGLRLILQGDAPNGKRNNAVQRMTMLKRMKSALGKQERARKRI
mmetsp:Transcript_16755/g.31580  ORF Transcript_16755/g.31580 Transcript_16755/m.31580 type:complete len:114 (-) Transcript_16755:292-633(-)